MKHYILYDKITGFISTQLSMTEKSLQKTLENNPNMSALIGRVPNVNKYQINVTMEPHTIETKPEPVINVTAYIRDLRTKLLKASDWTQTEDSPLSAEKKAEWATYRQALRDMPDTCSDCATVEDITWPTKPGA